MYQLSDERFLGVTTTSSINSLAAKMQFLCNSLIPTKHGVKDKNNEKKYQIDLSTTDPRPLMIHNPTKTQMLKNKVEKNPLRKNHKDNGGKREVTEKLTSVL